MKLSTNFSLEELSSTSHLDLLAENQKLAAEMPIIGKLYSVANCLLQPLRDARGSSIKVNSGFRSLAVNTRIGGAKASQHMLGEAADITVGSPAENKKLWELAIELNEQGYLHVGQLILEPTWVHISLGFPFRKQDGQIMTFDGKNYTLIKTLKYSAS